MVLQLQSNASKIIISNMENLKMEQIKNINLQLLSRTDT